MDGSVTVQLSAASGRIHFTRDGSTPSCTSDYYSTALVFRGLGTFKVRAIVCLCDKTGSTVNQSLEVAHSWELKGALFSACRLAYSADMDNFQFSVCCSS